MFVEDVLDHIEELFNNLLITRDKMMSLNVYLSKVSFTLFIWQRFAVHNETSCLIRSLYIKCKSRITPRSFTLNTGLISLHRNERVIDEGSFFNSWGVPIRRNLVFSGLISNSLAEHHSARDEGLLLGVLWWKWCL
jgi:hypothetical protein